ncbi:MAG: uL13 family ribosomal protein [Oscillospiraceae bacterium]
MAATVANSCLRKHKPIYTPHVDCGDHDRAQCRKGGSDRRKLDQKVVRHTGWIGGLKEVKYSKLMKTNPELDEAGC